jgi:farnesyl-diphosphate farnesyltransferase
MTWRAVSAGPYRVVWSKYAKDLDAFAKPENREAAVQCMNHLITIALEHATDSLEYLAGGVL